MLLGGSDKKKPKQGYGKKFFPIFRFVTTSFFYLKTQPIGAWKLQCAQFLQNQFLIFLQFVHWYLAWIVQYATELFIPKKSKLLIRESWFRFFLNYGLRTTIKITIFITFYVTDNFSSCYSQNSCKKIQTLSIKLSSK